VAERPWEFESPLSHFFDLQRRISTRLSRGHPSVLAHGSLTAEPRRTRSPADMNGLGLIRMTRTATSWRVHRSSPRPSCPCA